jgi:DNA-binding NarL/FixJ family response regulator
MKVCVVAAYEPLRDGLARDIAEAPDMEVIGAEPGLDELLDGKAIGEADVLVVDVDALNRASASARSRLTEWWSALNVLFIGSREQSRSINPVDIPAYVQLKTVGFLLREGPASRLIDVIRVIGAGTFVCESGTIRHILTRLSQWARDPDECNGTALSRRETEVLKLLVRGASNKSVAQELVLSTETVKTHVRRMMRKLEVTRRADLVRYALDKRLVTPEEFASGQRRL